MTQVKLLSFTPKIMTKKVILTLTDAETGEILASNKDERFLPVDRISPVHAKWFDSLMRGIKQGRELSLMITVRNNPSNLIAEQSPF